MDVGHCRCRYHRAFGDPIGPDISAEDLLCDSCRGAECTKYGIVPVDQPLPIPDRETAQRELREQEGVHAPGSMVIPSGGTIVYDNGTYTVTFT